MFLLTFKHEIYMTSDDDMTHSYRYTFIHIDTTPKLTLVSFSFLSFLSAQNNTNTDIHIGLGTSKKAEKQIFFERERENRKNRNSRCQRVCFRLI